MKGKIIVTGPVEYMCGAKLAVHIDGVKQAAKIARGEKQEFEIEKDSDVYGTMRAGALKSEAIRVSANAVTEIAFFLKEINMFQMRLEAIVTQTTSIADFDEGASETPIYDLTGARGRRIKVYEDRCIISTKVGVGSIITGNLSDGEKTIYYNDVIAVQFKRSNLQLGYLQLETAASTMNNKASNFFNKNTFTFDGNLDFKMEEVQKYIKQKVDEAKKQKNTPIVVAGSVSSADELKKFKELLDMGIITQEEFDAKKKQLLGL